jgi:hypothetical protein
MGDPAAVDTLAWGDSAVDILAWGDSAVDILAWGDSAVDILAWGDSAAMDILVFQVDILVFQVDILVFQVDILVFQPDILGLPRGTRIRSLFLAVAFTIVGNASLQAAIASLVLTIVSLMAIAIAMTISFTIETVFSLDLTLLRSDFRIGGTRGTQTMDILTNTTIPTTRRFMIIGIGAV